MDVICLGILVADIFTNPVSALPAAGQLSLTDRFLMSVGGCASNTAVCLSRLGRKAKVLGKVGTDLFGGFVLDELRRLGVDCSSVASSTTHPTSATVILNVTGEDRRFLHCIGANADFSFADVDCSVLDGASILYVGGYMVMPKFGADDLTQLFHAAKQRQVRTVLDVVTPPGLSMSRRQLESMLAHTDVFLPNSDEAEAMTGLKDPARQASFLSALNPACDIVVTLGAHGSVAVRNGEIIRAGTYAIQAVDESGAGDAFAAGYVTSLLEGWSLEKSLSFASAIGASSASALGCTAGVFTLDEALAFMSRQTLKIERIRL